MRAASGLLDAGVAIYLWVEVPPRPLVAHVRTAFCPIIVGFDDQHIRSADMLSPSRVSAHAAGNGDRAKKARKRRDPQRMVNYRLHQKLIRQDLNAAIAALEGRVDDLARSTLPWSEVARALREDRTAAETERDALVVHLRHHTKVVHEMYACVVSRKSLQVSFGSSMLTWQHVSLLSNATSRRLGKDWIVKQLYHNTTRMFDRYALHAATEPYMCVTLDFQETGLEVVHQGRLEVDCPLAIVRSALRHHFCAIHFMDAGHPVHANVETEATESTTVAHHKVITPRCQEHTNLLVGHYDEPDGFVLVARQVVDDDEFTNATFQSPRMFWYDVREASCGKTVVKYLIVEQQCRLADGALLPLHDEARIRGFTHADFGSEEQFQAAFRSYAKVLNKRCEDVFEAVVMEEYAKAVMAEEVAMQASGGKS